jgi:hypothetical protein
MIALLVVLAVLSPAERPIVDAKLHGPCEVSEVTIYASGFAHFQVSNSCGTGTAPEEFTAGLRKISGAELQQVEAAIAKSRFGSLPELITPDRRVPSSPKDVFSIRVWRNGVAKRVLACGLDRARDKGAAQHFQALWAAVVQLGPQETK